MATCIPLTETIDRGDTLKFGAKFTGIDVSAWHIVCVVKIRATDADVDAVLKYTSDDDPTVIVTSDPDGVGYHNLVMLTFPSSDTSTLAEIQYVLAVQRTDSTDDVWTYAKGTLAVGTNVVEEDAP